SGNIPNGYLFLCPLEDLRGDGTQFVFPDIPAYWSLDPLGAQRLGLSVDDAKNLGFPALQLEMSVKGFSWPEATYLALRHFHQAKGYDPDSQEIARHLGDPLYQL
ncbi:hypothetical protein B0H10DRAFT_1740883, partial [Mycena sp. CBHHK59/15]